MPNKLSNPRKRTIFAWCENHARMTGQSRYRQAEIMCEGGPSSPCSASSPCRMWAGRDFFTASVCLDEYPLAWARTAL